ncbi:MAG TPA: diguanylate cyclase [Polyangia bacterium]|nr:diguanylate cyclase [Polyangia bacterium]
MENLAKDGVQKEHIICVDDEEGILTALRQQLGARFGDECEIEVAQSAKDALELVEELRRDGEPLAVMIADQIMPGMKGVELLEEVHKRSPGPTKILLTGQAGLDAVVAAINKAGLNRYIPKPWDEPDLRLTVENLLKTFRLHRQNETLFEDLKRKNIELESAKEQLEEKVKERTAALEEANTRLGRLAVTDGLTELYNHRYFHEQLALSIERSQRSSLPTALLMIDVDHFKKYNDRQGHPAGDEALRTVARLISEDRRTVDVVARYGGEEFAVLLHDTTKQAALDVAEKIRARVAQAPIAHAEKQPLGRLTVSIGVAAYPLDATSAESLLEAADVALYRAKKSGRDAVVQSGTR